MTQDTITYIITGVVLFVMFIAIYVYVVRMTISLKRQLWNQKQMVKLLCTIARKLGADGGQFIDEVERKLDVPDDEL